jgi:class 3 adenylate cyclase
VTPESSVLPFERVGPYRIEGPIGAGGMGTVWRAWDERLRRHVAIKRVLSEAVTHGRERLRREARAAARLNHPAVVRIYDLLEREDGEWIVMELVPGQTLRALLDRQGPLEPRRAIRIGIEIAEGLAEAHTQGVLHRDLKTTNVMVTPAGHVRILDFGLAKDMPQEGVEGDLSLTLPGLLLGTCYAMSPEQVMGRPLDARSDLFSLGSLLYETLTGNPPFRGEMPRDSLALVLNRRPKPLLQVRPEVPEGLSVLVEQLLEKNVLLRPRSAREVSGFLAEMVETAGAGTAEPDRGGAVVSRAGLRPADVTQQTMIDLPSRLRQDFQAGGKAVATDPLSIAAVPAAGDRLPVTVLCCGLVGLDAAGNARRLDVEILSEAMIGLQNLARLVAGPLGGTLGSVLGQSLWLSFGDPQPRADAPERAVRAALRLLAQFKRLETGGGGRRLALRLALHTGPALIKARPGEAAQLQLGSTLDLVLGLQAVTPPGSVVVSGDCRRMIGGERFQLEALEPVRVQGFDVAVDVWRVE